MENTKRKQIVFVLDMLGVGSEIKFPKKRKKKRLLLAISCKKLLIAVLEHSCHKTFDFFPSIISKYVLIISIF
jgi:hypothetical protein